MSKNLYGVSLPVTGYIYVEVEASTEEEAQELAFAKEHKTEDIEEWDVCQSIVQGNIFCGTLNTVDVDYIKEVLE